VDQAKPLAEVSRGGLEFETVQYWSCTHSSKTSAPVPGMTKKLNVQFNNNRERRLSKGSLPDMNGNPQSPMKANGAKSPNRSSGGSSKSEKQGRLAVDRTDTSASGWATENEDDEKVGIVPQQRVRS